MFIEITPEGEDYLKKLIFMYVDAESEHTSVDSQDRMVLNLYNVEGPMEDSYLPSMVPEPVKTYMKRTILRLYEEGFLAPVNNEEDRIEPDQEDVAAFLSRMIRTRG